MGIKVDGDLNFWKIVDDKFYLNLLFVVQECWNEDVVGYIMIVDGKWIDIKDVVLIDFQ